MDPKFTTEEKLYLEAFGEKVRDARISAGLSQEELAHKCQLDRTYLSSIERGKRNITLLNLRKIMLVIPVAP